MTHRLAFAALAVCLATPPALAAPAASPCLTQSEAVAVALAHNPELRAAERQIEAAAARQQGAGVLPNPNVTLAVDEVPIPQPIQGIYTVGVSQPLLLGGQREARIEAARLETQLAGLDRDILRRDLAAQVKEAYARLLYAQEEVHLARLGDEAARTALAAARARFKAGELPEVEVFRAEVERSRTQQEVPAAESRELAVRGQLNVLLGRAAQTPLALEPLPLPAPGALPPVGSLVERALAARVELGRAEVAILRETAQRRVAQASLWTGTEANVSAGMVSGMPGFSTSISLPIPVYRQQAEIAEAEANRARAEAERDALKNALTLEVEQAYRDANIAAQQSELFRKTYLPQAQRLVANAERRFQEGAGSGAEVVEARREQREARSTYETRLLDYRLALTRLERAVGSDVTRR